jgi:hypothetical protein
MALAPMAAAAETPGEHAQAELANGLAQYSLAVQQTGEMQTQAQINMENERMIALLQSQAFREHQLGVTANGNALEQIGMALANAARAQGDLSARNELGIAQIKAAAIVMKADADVANAMAQGRVDEIANANAQSTFAHHLADVMTSVLGETNMNSARLNSQIRADMIHGPSMAEEQNGRAMGANDLLAADLILAAGQVNATSSQISSSTKASALIGHAAASLANARAMVAANP